jgi:hypothetical protein
MILKLKNYHEMSKIKNISEENLNNFFKTGLELGIFRVIGNEGSEILYETNDNPTITGPQILLNEKEKIINFDIAKNLPEPKKTESDELLQSKPAPVGNTITSGFSNPFKGTSWGK